MGFLESGDLRGLEALRICAILHDIGKPISWAMRRPWSEHIYYTHELLRRTLGEDYANTAMRHHSGASYPSKYHPQTEDERIIWLSDNLASGADRREMPEAGGYLPTLPIRLSHILSRGERVRVEHDEPSLQLAAGEAEGLLIKAAGCPDEAAIYRSLFYGLRGSRLRLIPADTRPPINDVSLWDHLKLTAAFTTCISLSGGYRGDEPRDYTFALVSGDADRVSDYVNRSLRLPDLSARSRKISDATRAAGMMIERMLGPECLIYVGGGSFLALSPRQLADKIASEAKRTFEDLTQGEVTITTSHVEADGEAVQSFGKLWESCRRKMREKKLMRPEPMPSPLEEDETPCDVCRARPGRYEDPTKMLPALPPRPELLCDACWRLREEGRRLGERAELDYLGEKTGFVAVLRMDGDDMGRVLEGGKLKEFGKESTPSRLAAISTLIHETCEMSLRRVVDELGGICLYAGGDDLLAILPGENALEAARRAASCFREGMVEECSISAGVSIFHYKLPVYVGLEASQSLLRSAKGREGKNSVAFAIIGSTGITDDALQEISPYTWDELRELLGVVDYLQGRGLPMSQIRRMATLSRPSQEGGNPHMAEAFVKYLVGRDVIPWSAGRRLLEYMNSGLLHNAFLVYNAFRRGGGEGV
ncbi:MAG: type III-B CRISPR-associated protein Cas10/Cmr2 [Candidatus Bathyarchaeia archaeon]